MIITLKLLQLLGLIVSFVGLATVVFDPIGLFIVAFGLMIVAVVTFYTLMLTDFHEVYYKAKKGKVLAVIIGEDNKVRFKAMKYLRGWVWDKDEKGHYGYILSPDNIYIYKGAPVALFYRSHVNSLNAKVLADLTLLEKHGLKPVKIQNNQYVPVDYEIKITGGEANV